MENLESFIHSSDSDFSPVDLLWRWQCNNGFFWAICTFHTPTCFFTGLCLTISLLSVISCWLMGKKNLGLEQGSSNYSPQVTSDSPEGSFWPTNSSHVLWSLGSMSPLQTKEVPSELAQGWLNEEERTAWRVTFLCLGRRFY